MNLKILKEEFTVCKVENYDDVDLEREFVFTAYTDEEKSLVCPTGVLPQNTIQREDGWRGFRIEGVLDFSLKGILYRISKILYDENIGIFVVSTYNTDYIFVKEEDLELAVLSLEKGQYKIKREC